MAGYIACVVAAELLGSKIFQVSFIKASVAIFILPITFTINDVIVEVLGKERARSLVRSSLYILIGLAFFNYLSLILPPAARFLPTNEAYNTIFAKSLRITLASLTAFFVSERLDVYIFAKIRTRLGNKKLWLRNNLSNILSMLVDTIVFYSLAFYSPGNINFLISIMWPYWLLKCSMSVIETPFTYLGIRWLKK